MYRTRTNRWNCTKLADYIRGSKKPYALGWEEWDKWHDDAKKVHPFRYWFAEEFLKRVQDFILFPCDVYHTVRIYIRNRWIDKPHYINTGLKPGGWYEFDTRILHGLFNELVNFVESELALMGSWNSEKKYKWTTGRCKEAAYDYFDWCNNLKNESDNQLSDQAKAYRKIKKLYEWWTISRPNRVDPYLSIDDKKLFGNKNKKSKQQIMKAYEIEEFYEEEDTKMLIELIKVRRHLWT